MSPGDPVAHGAPQVPSPRGCRQEPHSASSRLLRGTRARPSSLEPGLVLRPDPDQRSVYGGGAEAVQGSGEQTHPPASRPWTFTAGLTCQALGTKRAGAPVSAELAARQGQTMGRSRAIDRKCHFVPSAGQGHGRGAPQLLLDPMRGAMCDGDRQTLSCLLPPPARALPPLPTPRAVQSSCPLWFLLMKGNSTHPETRLLPAGI